MSLQVWLPLNQGPKSMVGDISTFGKESSVTITADTDGWYKIADSSHTSSRWGIYKDFYVKSNTTYTLTVYSKSTTGIATNIGIQSFNGYTAWPAQRDTNNTSTEKLTTYTWTTAATDNYARVYLAMNPGSTVANNYVFYKGVEIWETPEIKNQGLNGGKITDLVSYDTWMKNGKLGSCLKTSTTNHIDLGYNGNQVNTGSISFGGWFKFNKAEMQTLLSTYTYTDVRNQPTGNLIGNNSYGGVSLNWYTNNMYSSNGVLNNLYILGSIRSTNNGARTTGGIEIPFETWINLYVVFNKETKILQLWKDGVLQQYSTMLDFDDARNQNLMLNYNAVWGGNGPSFNLPFLVNDIRIYNHALSEKEIKKISQGLVCHYNLSNNFIESTTNLVTTEDGLSSTCYNGATSKYGYGTNTDMYKTLGTFEGRKSTKVYMGTAGLSAYPYVYFDNFNAAGTTIQTLSFYYFPTLQNTIIPYSYNGSYNFSYKTDKASGSATNVSQIIIPVDVGRWNYITITAQKYDTTNTSRGIGYIRIGSTSHTSTTSNYWLFNNVQVEAKDHATGYAGVGGTRTSTFIYDSSGFENHGTISGALTISTDTPKYKYSIQMPAAATISHTRCLDNTNQEWSCAAWVKPTTAGNYQNLNNFNEFNRLYHGTYPLLYLNSGTNDYYNYGNLALPANQWSHIVFVFQNSTGTKLIYINGVNHTNTNGPNRTSTPKGIPDTVIIGSGNYEGGLCDYCEYATALSAEDVLALYNNKNF